MSEPACEEMSQPSAEFAEKKEANQVVEDEGAEESQPEKEVEAKIQIQQENEEKEESAPEDQKVELQPEIEDSESHSQEEQQQQIQDEREDPQKEFDDSQDTIQMPITDTPERALEDEEMPSMVTISSTSRIDESDTYNKQDEDSKLVEIEKYSPKPVVRQEKDSDSDSVCVIDDDDDDDEDDDDDDDEEEDNRNDRRRIRHNDEEDEGESSYDDEYDGSFSYDSDEMDDEEQYNEKYDRSYKRNERRDNNEGVEDDDEEEDVENEDEFMDDQDFGGGGSDDAVLRPNSNGLLRQQKEHSSSLQDLSLIEGSSPKNRHTVNPFSQKARLERTQGKAKPYAHVQSKVKKYINDLSEQRRMSIERRKKSIDEARHKNDEPTDIQIQRSEEVVMACQTMKNYAEKTLKEFAESEENKKMIFLQQGVENGEISLIPRLSMPPHAVEIINNANEMEIDLVEEEDEKRPVINGTVLKENQNNLVTERKGILRREDGPPKSSIFNGEDPLSFEQPIDNLRTLTYDEYMGGRESSQVNEEVVNRIEISEVQSISVQNAEIEDDSGLRIESVVSNYSSEKVIEDFQNRQTPPIMVNQSTETFYQENPEIQTLRLQLNQRNQQFESLREAYQKNMSENMAMRMELDNLRKAVTYYQEQQKSRIETKVSAVQTEIPANFRDMPLIDLDGNDPKLGVSAVSTQWSDSTGSVAAISMDPPNVTTALNSDESAQPVKTPIHKRNALSRAFMTSTKILQTLSSITHGKTKIDKFTKPPKINEAEKSSKLGPPNSKKRKASDAIDDSTQPTKIPKSNEQEAGAPTTPEPQFINPNTMEHESTDPSIGKKTDQRQMEESSSDDDVKVYVYPEDEEGREHSFLIQATEVTNNPKPGVRECGPYLLGNVEVYMTEVNGTINIWGKELSQTSQTTTEDLDASARSRDLRQNLRWQSTPRIFNKHEGVSAATTSKKSSRLLPRYMQQQQESHCEHNNILPWSSCHEHQHQHQHSCCNIPSVVETSCGCVHEQKRTPSGCCKAKSMPNMNQNCCCSGHRPLPRRHSFNPTDDEDSNEEEDPNRTLQAEDCSPHSFSKSNNIHQRSAEPRRSTGGSPNDPSTSYENETDPLISKRQVLESFEGTEKGKKKKVRGLLMDLLRKGCAGDCRAPMDKSNLHHTTSIYEPSTSAQHRSPCLPSQPSYSHRPNDKCSSCCKPDKTSQIEAKMERFREEMDKLRSQSDTLAGMIQALKNADVI